MGRVLTGDWWARAASGEAEREEKGEKDMEEEGEEEWEEEKEEEEEKEREVAPPPWHPATTSGSTKGVGHFRLFGHRGIRAQ